MPSGVKIKHGLRRPPPRPVTPSNRHESDDRQNNTPTYLKLAIIAFTCIGLVFLLRVANLPPEDKSTPSSTATNSITNCSAGDALPQAPIQKKPDKSPAAPTSVAPLDLKHNITPNSPRSEGLSQMESEGLADDLIHIEQNVDSNLSNPETSIYLHISENIKYCLQTEMAILKNNRKGSSSRYQLIQEKAEKLNEQGDPPYFTYTIAAYSRLLAEASVEISSAFREGLGPQSESVLETIRRTPIEATCDALFVTAATLLSLPKNEMSPNGRSLSSADIRRDIEEQRSKDQHITKKTEAAHRVLCDAIAYCVRTTDQSGIKIDSISGIERKRNEDIAIATDSFFRTLAYTEAEARLMLLWANLLTR